MRDIANDTKGSQLDPSESTFLEFDDNRLYSKTSMKQANTVFPGLGSPITHVDIIYDGKWILGTTETYLIFICTLFTNKDRKTKTGFSGRLGNKIPAPRLLKLTPVDSHMAGVDNKFHGGQFSWVS
ncbi:hypothetical protein LguiB_033602 [Lonicera macranthoides]